MKEKKTKKKETKEKKKKVVKKETVKKVEKKISRKRVKKEKTAVPNKEPFDQKLKRFLMSYAFLGSLFGVLFILVIVLFIIYTTTDNETNTKKSNIVFSILEKDTNNYINIDLQSLVGKEYALKVTNHRQGVLNKEGAVYLLRVTNNSNAEIEIQKGDDLENLMKDQKETIIEGKPFSKTKKEEVIYYFRVKADSEVKEGDTLRIEVIS